MTTTDRLNAAAKKLRETAGACDPWMGSEGVGSWSDEYATDSGNGSDAALIRIMHPGVALALANAMDSAADHDPLCDDGGDGEGMHADLQHVADLILGDRP